MNTPMQAESPAFAVHTLLFEESTPQPFDFEATIASHGWVVLQPFGWNEARTEISRTHQLDNGQVVWLRLWAGEGATVQVEVQSAEPLNSAGEVKIRWAVRRMLRLDEDLSPFYQLCGELDGAAPRLNPGAGRLLRCPRLFEDIVYTLCTTNIAWSGTKRMVERLTAKLGEPFPGRSERRAFPNPAAIAAAGPDFLKQETGLGYRSDYVWELARAIATGELDLGWFEDPDLSGEILYRELRQLRGVGPYAAATIMMLLGRYEHLAIDSEMRAFVSRRYFENQPASEAQIRAIYAPWGQWQYLAYWFDLVAEA